MTELKKEENKFRFVLLKNNNSVIDEQYFSADVYSPKVRYNVDIRDDVDEIIVKLQDLLNYHSNTKKNEVKYKFIIYKNNNTIIERYFTAEEFNSRIADIDKILSIRSEVNNVVVFLEEILKKKDYECLWEQFELEENLGYRYKNNK